jgi:hypothetical protein
MYANTFSEPASNISSGVGNAENNSGVTLFTETSVAWALRITEINNSKGFR